MFFIKDSERIHFEYGRMVVKGSSGGIMNGFKRDFKADRGSHRGVT